MNISSVARDQQNNFRILLNCGEFETVLLVICHSAAVGITVAQICTAISVFHYL